MATHIKIWLAIILLVILAAPFAAPPDRLRAIAGHELELMRSALGNEDTNAIVRSANASYSSMFLDTGIVQALRGKTTSEEQRGLAGQSLGRPLYQFSSLMNEYLLSFITLTYITMLRGAMLLGWIPFLAPFLAAVAVDGSAQHKVLHSSVAVSNPVKFKIALHLTIAASVVPILYLFAPIAISPYFVLGWAIAIALPLVSVIAQMSPMSYR